ncbi:ImmA/IrrE family metallo-endopeptidase [Ensifer sp. P24N7]|uniref:ImmA/IrrE family metallo-endopeptidase n=1 Tax=Sinorhizobium sp. P24N7 TaxID=3348358 RepID=UPI0035F3C228
MAEAMINQRVLAWAVDRSDVPLETVAKKVAVKPERIENWILGDDRPTFRQAQSLSAALHIPFGYLFLKEPPEEKLPIPDLRTVGSDPARRLDTNFRTLLNDVLFKRDWFKDFVAEYDGKKLGFVGKFGLDDDPKEIASDIRKTLYGEHGEPITPNWEKHLRMLITKAEEAGIWVMRNGVVGSNTHRPLSVSQFRGFAISDSVVPLIFINGRDAPAAQIFTLAHELAHIWLGESGISNVMLGETDLGTHKRVEKKCNQIAAEFLVPTARFRARWDEEDALDVNADRLAKFFKVSRIVIVRRAFDLGLVSESDYRHFYARESARWDPETSDNESRGNFYNTLPIRNGSHFTNAVVRQAMSGRLLLKHAASLLNTQPASVVSFYRKALGGR